MAETGQRSDVTLLINKEMPWQNGSIFEAFICTPSLEGRNGSSTITSPHEKWHEASYPLSVGTVSSPMCMKPKYARQHAAQSIITSALCALRVPHTFYLAEKVRSNRSSLPLGHTCHTFSTLHPLQDIVQSVQSCWKLRWRIPTI